MTEKMIMIEQIVKDLKESVEVYEKVKDKKEYVYVGYDIKRFDSKESIKRRITVVREELLKVSKMMEVE